MGALPEIHMPDDAHLPRDTAMDLPPIPEGTSGGLQVLHRILPQGQSIDYFKEQITWPHDKVITVLHHLGNTWMSDTPQEMTAMGMAARAARGDVLVTGMGLGIFQRSAPDEVRSVTTLEVSPDVVRLVWRHLSANDKRQRCVLGNAEDTMSAMIQAGRTFDFIYLDTWDSGDYEQLPWVNWYIRKAYELLADGGEVYAWTYESMIRSLVEDTITFLPSLKKAGHVHERKRQGMRNMWPMLGQFVDWYLDGEHEDDAPPDEAACRAWVEHLGRTFTSSPGHMMKLSDRRMEEEASRELVEAMKADPVKVALASAAHVESIMERKRKKRRDGDDPGAILCKM